ncbi:Uncharacterised protein [Sphingobacterium daejeonense]|nr:Uncharacterised protein [Sphingobacterium daejeonense]
MELIMGPWPWYVGGGIVALVMIALILLGRSFGFSSNFRNICSALGAGNTCSFFDFDWRKQKWNLLFLVGAVIGGFLSAHFLSNNQVPQISAATIAKLNELGFESAGKEYVPSEIFKTMNLKKYNTVISRGAFDWFWYTLRWWMYIRTCNFRVE